MEKHITLVAAFNIGFGILGILTAIILFVILVGAGFLSEDPEAMTILSTVAIFLGSFFVVTSIPEIIGGIGLLKRRPWARILIIIIAVLDLFAIPIGTAIGVYSLWVMLNDETANLFSGESVEGKK